MVTYNSYMPQLLQALSQKASENNAERLAAEERDRASQLNPLGMLAGALTGGGLSGMFDKAKDVDWGNALNPKQGGIIGKLGEALQKTDWSKLGTKEAIMGGASGGIQPVMNSPKDIISGAVAGQTMATNLNDAETKKAMDILDKRKEVLTNFDIVPKGTTNSFDISTVLPGIFNTETYVKRKEANPLLGAITTQMGLSGVNLGQAPTYNEGDQADIKETGKTAIYKGGQWIYKDSGIPVPPKFL